MAEFDPAKYKQAQHDQWNNDAAAWHRWGPTLKDWFGIVTTTILDLAKIGPGSRVLDIATGAGEPALSEAEQVGPNGYVLATDLSENFIPFVQLLAAERHLQNVEARAMDGENLQLCLTIHSTLFCAALG